MIYNDGTYEENKCFGYANYRIGVWKKSLIA